MKPNVAARLRTKLPKTSLTVRLPQELVARIETTAENWRAWARQNKADATAVDRTFVIETLLSEALDRESKGD